MAQVYSCFQFLLLFSAVKNPAWKAALFTNFTSTARVDNLRPAEAFYPVRDNLLSSGLRPFFFFNNSYAAVNRRNDPHLLINSSKKRRKFVVKTPFFWSLPSIRLKKGVNFWRRPFSFGPLEWWRPAGTLLGVDVAH